MVESLDEMDIETRDRYESGEKKTTEKTPRRRNPGLT